MGISHQKLTTYKVVLNNSKTDGFPKWLPVFAWHFHHTLAILFINIHFIMLQYIINIHQSLVLRIWRILCWKINCQVWDIHLRVFKTWVIRIRHKADVLQRSPLEPPLFLFYIKDILKNTGLSKKYILILQQYLGEPLNS